MSYLPRPVYRGMYGLGDNIYQRAVIKHLGPVQLITPWPQLYSDLPCVQCLRDATSLRTQAKNQNRTDLTWAEPQRGFPVRDISYVGRSGTILQGLFSSATGIRTLGMQPNPVLMDLPLFPPLPFLRGDYVVVRPTTVRSEWTARSRNPDPWALCEAAAEARRQGYRVVSVADLSPGKEWVEGPLPPADFTFHAGELRLEELMGLVRFAKGLIGGVGWMLPAALAYRVPMLLVYGGWGMSNGPQRVLDPRLDTSRLVSVMPDRFCMCENPDHNCEKTIPKETLHERLTDFLRLLEQPVPRLVA